MKMVAKVDLAAVNAGCKQIDEAIEQYDKVLQKLSDGTSLLDNNNLKFGDINSSLDEQLDILRSEIEKCSVINEGVTATIRNNAQEQYEEYQAYLASLKKNNNDNDTNAVTS